MTDVVEFCNDYLRCGGLFNPEHMDNRRVGLLILECRDEIERLREALLDCHHVLHKLMGIVPGNDTAVDEMAKAMAKARSALGEGKE
jgi:hypothetical protein